MSELKLKRPPTDIAVRHDILYVSTKGKRVFCFPGGGEESKSILFSYQVNAIDASNDILYCGCADGKVFGLDVKHKVVFRSSSDDSGVTGCKYNNSGRNIFISTFNKKIEILGENAILQNTFYCHNAPITGFDVSNGGTLVCAAQNSKVLKIIDVNTKIIIDLQISEGFPEVVLFISEDSFLVGTVGGNIYCYTKSKSNFDLKAKYKYTAGIQSFFLANKNTLLVGFSNQTIGLFRVNKREIELIDEFAAPGIPIGFCEFKGSIAVAVGREPRLGRWGKIKSAKNTILMVKIER